MKKGYMNLSFLIIMSLVLPLGVIPIECNLCDLPSPSSKSGTENNVSPNSGRGAITLDDIRFVSVESIHWEPGAGANEKDFSSNLTLTLHEDVAANDYPNPGETFLVSTDAFPNTTICFGDGTCVEPLTFTVTSTDPANYTVLGTADVSHTYPEPDTYIAYIESCCRVVRSSDDCFDPPINHVNNPMGFQRMETTVDVWSGNSSPVSAMPPVVECTAGELCTFTVPATDPNGDPLTFRLSTSLEASGTDGGFTQPGPPYAPNAATIDPNTGVFTWDTTGATSTPGQLDCPDTLYSAQVMIEDPSSKVPVDFIIKLVYPETIVCQECPTGGSKGCISGKVMETGTKAPLADKIVRLKRVSPEIPKVSKKRRTGAGGCFIFKKLDDGTYKLWVKDCKGKRRKTIVDIVDGEKVNNVKLRCKRTSTTTTTSSTTTTITTTSSTTTTTIAGECAPCVGSDRNIEFSKSCNQFIFTIDGESGPRTDNFTYKWDGKGRIINVCGQATYTNSGNTYCVEINVDWGFFCINDVSGKARLIGT